MALLIDTATSNLPQTAPPVHLDSLFQILVGGGPVMIPLAICSVIALGFILERLIRLRTGVLGSRQQMQLLVAALRNGGVAQAREMAKATPTVLSRIFQPAFDRWSEDRPALEKAVEDSGSREIRALVSSLRPLTVIAVCAPLLGLLGTVIGIIIAFRDIALSNAMGKPEALSIGIAQALVTTASGLAIAIPTQVAYYWLRAKIDRFWRLVEELGEHLFAEHGGRGARPPVSAASAPQPPPLEQAPIIAQATS